MSKSFLEPKSVAHTVNGEKKNFWPVSVTTLFGLRQMAQPIATAIAVLFTDNKDDCETTTRNFSGATPGSETIVSAITPDLASQRTSERDQAISRLISAALDAGHAQVFGRIVMDSMREDFEHDVDRPADDVAEFMSEVDPGTLMQLMYGVWKANKEMFRPLIKAVAKAAPHLTGTAEQMVDKATKAAQQVSSKMKSTG